LGSFDVVDLVAAAGVSTFARVLWTLTKNKNLTDKMFRTFVADHFGRPSVVGGYNLPTELRTFAGITFMSIHSSTRTVILNNDVRYYGQSPFIPMRDTFEKAREAFEKITPVPAGKTRTYIYAGMKVPDDYVVTSFNSGNEIQYKDTDNKDQEIQKVFSDFKIGTLPILPQPLQGNLERLINKYRNSTDKAICTGLKRQIDSLEKDLEAHKFLLSQLRKCR
jgi:hypothetical protein